MQNDFIPDMAQSAALSTAYKTVSLLGLVGVLAGAVAMALTPPKDAKEFVRRLVVTILTSILIGPLIIEFLGFQDYSFRSQVGICFLTGVPSWLVWSWVQGYLEKSQNKTPTEIAKEINEVKKAFKNHD